MHDAPAASRLLHPAPAPSFDDPLGMLLACHGRMRRQLGTLSRLSRHLSQHGIDADARNAAMAVVRYFDRAAPDHHADEDLSLMPRVVTRAPEMASLASSLRSTHERLDLRWRKVRPLLSSIAVGRRQALPLRLVDELCRDYESHLAQEEAQVLPRARDLLDAAVLDEIGREFAARRAQ
jgi:hemerythrin-like domain-containing protein